MCTCSHKHTLTYDSLCLSVYEDEDLRELRASMERLLQEQRSEDDDDDDDEEEDDGGGSSGSPADEEAAGLNGLANAGDDKCSPEECFNRMAVEEDDVSHGEEEPGGPVTNGMEVEEDEEQNSSEGQLNEEWQSGKAITTASITTTATNGVHEQSTKAEHIPQNILSMNTSVKTTKANRIH